MADAATLAELEKQTGRSALCGWPWTAGGLALPINPNGSVADIAGICNERGNVLGLMPHPEDHLLPIQNPLGRSDRLGGVLFGKMIAWARAVGGEADPGDWKGGWEYLMVRYLIVNGEWRERGGSGGIRKRRKLAMVYSRMQRTAYYHRR